MIEKLITDYNEKYLWMLAVKKINELVDHLNTERGECPICKGKHLYVAKKAEIKLCPKCEPEKVERCGECGEAIGNGYVNYHNHTLNCKGKP